MKTIATRKKIGYYEIKYYIHFKDRKYTSWPLNSLTFKQKIYLFHLSISFPEGERRKPRGLFNLACAALRGFGV